MCDFGFCYQELGGWWADELMWLVQIVVGEDT